MSVKLLIVNTFLWLSFQGFSANWYVDSSATGANNGTSWANAWTALTNMNMASVAAGDTVNISGGTYYGTVALYNLNDTGGSPSAHITFKASQEAGHNGKVVQYGGWALNKRCYTFDGSKSPSVEAQVTNTLQVANVPTNCNWQINSYWTNGATTNWGPCFNLIDGNPTDGLEIKWIEMTANAPKGPVPDTLNTWQVCRGLVFANQTAATNQFYVHHCWAHDIAWDFSHGSVNAATSQATNYLLNHWEYLLLERIGQDAFEWNGPRTINNCIVRQTLGYEGHQDGFILLSGYHRIYNNIIYDFAFDGNIWGNPNFYNTNHLNPLNYQIYGNLLYYTTNYWTNFFTNHIVGSAIRINEEDGYIVPSPPIDYWDGILLANNTIHATNALSATIMGLANTKYSGMIFYLTNEFYANNIAYQSYPGASSAASFGAWTNVAGINAVSTTNNCLADYNIVSGATSSNVTYIATTFANAEAMNAALPYKSNSSAPPRFENILTHNYAINAADTAAKGKGTNLTTLGLPGWDYDLAGNPRVRTGGLVDIGAYAFTQDPALILRYTFDDLGAGGAGAKVTDVSGGGHDMLFYGFSGTPTNWPTRVAYTNGTAGGYAGQFWWDTNSIGQNQPGFPYGQFGAITNLGALTNLTAITVAAWVKYFQPAAAGYDGNSCIIETTYGTNGCSWSLGRNSAMQTSFDIFTNLDCNTSGSLHINFPDNESVDWLFYTATFSTTNKMLSGYLNGTNFINSDLTGKCAYLTNLTVGYGQTGVALPALCSAAGAFSGNQGWLSIGVRTHSGSPTLTDGDGFPNNGWMNGQVRDLRIYNRALSAAEVTTLYQGGEPGGGAGGGQAPAAGPSVTAGTVSVQNLIIGQ